MMCERGANAVAVDISTSMLIDGEAQFQKGIFFNRVAANMAILPFRDQSVQAIFFSAAIHHANDLSVVFAECARCLEYGGYIVLMNEPVRGKLRKGLNFGEADKLAGMNEHIYSIDEYRNAASLAGLQTRIYFPDSLSHQLSGRSPYPPTIGLRAARLLWPILKPFARHLTFPLHRLLGIDLVMRAGR